MSKKLAAAVLCAGLLFVGAFGLDALGSGGGAAARTVASDGPLRLEVASGPREAVAMAETELLLKLTDDSGQPVEGAIAEAYLIMPSMYCGRIPAQVSELSDGEYRLTGVPVMKGKWEATIEIVRGNDKLIAEHRFTAL